jgi:phage terminase large subunit GpA-like protein
MLRAPRLEPGSQWAEKHYWMSTGARVGRWICLAFQREILDALTDPAVDRVTLLKSAQVGATQMGNIFVAQRIAQRPSSILVVQPTIVDAEEYSQTEIAPMLDAVECLRGLVKEPRTKGSDTNKRFKRFPGGVLRLRGANAPAGLRRFGADSLFGDEAAPWPDNAGGEGDPLALAEQRTKDYAERMIYLCSTPIRPGDRITAAYLAGDRCRFHVPCLKCGVFDVLIPRLPEGHERTPDGSKPTGHAMAWKAGRPSTAHFVCSGCAREIPYSDRAEMVAAGYWVAGNPGALSDDGRLHRSFHIWAAYSPAPNAKWAQIAERLERAWKDPEKLQVAVNTDCGLPFVVTGDAPDWQPLHDRREGYQIGTVPPGPVVLTAGVDVQKDRVIYEVVGWGANKESWSIEADVLDGDTSTEDSPIWNKLTELLWRTWPTVDGGDLTIRKLAIDSGYNTDQVYAWVNRQRGQAMAVKGLGEDKPTADMLLGVPKKTALKANGSLQARRCLVWPVGAGRAKTQLYGWLGLARLEDGKAPAGYCHFPQYGEEFFRQLTAEHKIAGRDENGRIVEEWAVKLGHENHFLDARVYARAALEHPTCRAALARAERAPQPAAPPTPRVSPPRAASPSPPPAAQPAARRPDRSLLDDIRGGVIRDFPWRR